VTKVTWTEALVVPDKYFIPTLSAGGLFSLIEPFDFEAQEILRIKKIF
jgi:hypothetical protein